MTTSDSIDRVFSHALATVRRLPRTGSSRPPPEARLRLYGLYKQSMEGDVDAILPRPSLPPPSPPPALLGQQQQQGDAGTDPNDQRLATMTQQDASKGAGSVLTRYGSRQLRTREAQAEIEKWDAWHACKGMSQTAAKKAYIRTLIETMKEYASGTQESRELVGELEFVWRQISRRRGDRNDEDDEDDEDEDDDGYQETEEDSPRRSGLVQLGQGRRFDHRNRRQSSGRGGGADNKGKMTLLSPVGQSEAEYNGGVVANEEVRDDGSASAVSSQNDNNHGHDHDNNGDRNRNRNRSLARGDQHGDDDDPWRHSVEAHLRHLSTEIAALREQLSSHYLLAPSGYSPYMYQHLSFRWRIWYKMLAWVRWAVWMAVRQLVIQFSLFTLAILYGRWKGDGRLEAWLQQRLRVALSQARRGWGWVWQWRWLKKIPFG